MKSEKKVYNSPCQYIFVLLNYYLQLEKTYIFTSLVLTKFYKKWRKNSDKN